MNCRVIFTLITFAAGLAAQAAHGATLLPTDDGFGYQGTPTIAQSENGFAPFLPVGATTSGHGTSSALRFDLSSLGLTAGQVSSATLDLFLVDTALTGFGINPTPAQPLTVNLFGLGAGAWTESTLTYSNLPTAVGAAYDSVAFTGFNQAVSFDVTELVKDWLDGTLANNGLSLLPNAAVGSSMTGWVFATFSSSESMTASSPMLNVVAVPEPGSLVLALFAVPALAWYGRRRRSGR